MSKKYENLDFTDNFMFTKIMSDESICKGVIESLTDLKINRIVKQESEKTIEIDPYAKGVRFDVYVETENNVFDIEMQVAKENDIAKRMRYYQSVIDAATLDKGCTYSELRKMYIIFICKADPLENKQALYEIRSICTDTNRVMDDGVIKMIYNISEYEKLPDNSAKKLMKFLATGESSDKLSESILKAVEQARINSEWRNEYMNEYLKTQGLIYGTIDAAIKYRLEEIEKKSQEMVKELSLEMAKELSQEMAKELSQEMAKELSQEMVEERLVNMAKKMASNGMSIDEIAEYTQLSRDRIDSIIKN